MEKSVTVSNERFQSTGEMFVHFHIKTKLTRKHTRWIIFNYKLFMIAISVNHVILSGIVKTMMICWIFCWVIEIVNHHGSNVSKLYEFTQPSLFFEFHSSVTNGSSVPDSRLSPFRPDLDCENPDRDFSNFGSGVGKNFLGLG